MADGKTFYLAQHILDAIKGDDDNSAMLREIAKDAIEQSKDLARSLLKTGMLAKADKTTIDNVIDHLTGRIKHRSHGSVINAEEAISLGLNVDQKDAEDEYWRRIWFLRCAYEFDLNARGWGRIFEGRHISFSLHALNGS
jgi:hypothetical protein